ncbi:unnamed protein product [Closterium sp. NIES-54]
MLNSSAYGPAHVVVAFRGGDTHCRKGKCHALGGLYCAFSQPSCSTIVSQSLTIALRSSANRAEIQAAMESSRFGDDRVAALTASSATDGSPTPKFMAVISHDAPAAPASPTTSNVSNTVSVSSPPRVPKADKDETPSAVKEGAPEDEHQPPPGITATDTSEHPESQPEGSHASLPTMISGESDATPLNPLALKLLHFVRRVNGGIGMAEVDINVLLQLMVEPGLAHLVTSELRNCKDLERFEMERLAELNRGWSVANFEIDGHPPQHLLFQNLARVSRL